MFNPTNKEVYFCYSLRLFHFLKMNGFYYIYKDRLTSGRFYWVFEKTEQLQSALTEFSNVKMI